MAITGLEVGEDNMGSNASNIHSEFDPWRVSSRGKTIRGGDDDDGDVTNIYLFVIV